MPLLFEIGNFVLQNLSFHVYEAYFKSTDCSQLMSTWKMDPKFLVFIYFQTRKESDFVPLVKYLKSFSSCETTFFFADVMKAALAIG